MKFGKRWPWKLKRNRQLMLIAYNHSGPVPRTSHIRSLNPTKSPSFIAQMFTRASHVAGPECCERQPPVPMVLWIWMCIYKLRQGASVAEGTMTVTGQSKYKTGHPPGFRVKTLCFPHLPDLWLTTPWASTAFLSQKELGGLNDRPGGVVPTLTTCHPKDRRGSSHPSDPQ